MAVDQVSARSVQALTSAGAQDASGLREGTQLEGRVIAVNSDDSLRLATRYGLLDVDQSQISVIGGSHGRGRPSSLTDLIGTTVKLEITGQNTASGRFSVKLVTPGDPAPATLQAQDVATPAADIEARIAAEVSRAAARQDGLAPVFSGARQLASAEEPLPDSVSQALEDLASLALDGSSQISADDIRAAVSSSGVFLEAKLARWASGTSDGESGFGLNPDVALTSQDIKAALFGLKSALDSWIAQATAESEPPAPGTATPEEVVEKFTAVANQSAPEPLANQAEAASAFDTEALFAVLRPPPSSSSQALQQASLFPQTGNNGPAILLAGASSRPDLVTMAALGEWFQTTGQSPQNGGGRRGAYGSRQVTSERLAPPPQANDSAAPGRPPPPRRGSLPHGQAAVSPTSSPARQPMDIARDLSLKTGNALARISLGQYASLPERAAAPHAATQPSAANVKAPASWLFEIPLTIGGSTSIAQFEIDQVGDGGQDATRDVRAWRVQFSLDIPPMGPIHARLLLADHRLSVGLWAEDRIGATALQRGILSLRQSLEAAEFVIDEIHFAAGRPPSGPPVRAGGFIDRNA